ncbi:hypothetical protein I547_7452 [Mycobacterium kansasii 824]|nr:hypothetical protein I547_7452 [Mycobacterium kansasii 824]
MLRVNGRSSDSISPGLAVAGPVTHTHARMSSKSEWATVT